ELSRRDRLAEGFASRLGERPACDLLEEPGAIDEATSLLAARLFHGGPAESGADWAPVDWQEYPDEVVDRTWRTDAARLHRVLDALGVHSARARAATCEGPTLARVLDHLAADPDTVPATATAALSEEPLSAPPDPDLSPETYTDAELDALLAPTPRPEVDTLSAGLSAELAREESARPAHPAPTGQGPDGALWDEGALPLFPLQPPRTGRELLADHVTAMVCCAAVDTAGATPGLDWLDGPALLVDGERAADLGPPVLSLVEDGDPVPLKGWLARLGIRPEKPVRLV
ncbi:hypothetical protein G3I40_15165, partial [Streptomyces sp. SID14478]|nr:hypothetical protein [Streptomyces sp. SID14478]